MDAWQETFVNTQITFTSSGSRLKQITTRFDMKYSKIILIKYSISKQAIPCTTDTHTQSQCMHVLGRPLRRRNSLQIYNSPLRASLNTPLNKIALTTHPLGDWRYNGKSGIGYVRAPHLRIPAGPTKYSILFFQRHICSMLHAQQIVELSS